jgi:diacylglycerol kinase (CTP)
MKTEFKQKSDLHLFRKAWHMGGVMILFLIWIFFKFPISTYIFAACWIVFVPGDVVRIKYPEYNKIFNKLFKLILRSTELDRLAGTTYLLTSVIFISMLFSHTIVGLSLLFLAFADPLASYAGIKWGRHKIFGHKSYEGFFAAFVVCAIITYSVLSYLGISTNLFYLSLIAGLCGALAELIPLGKMDDNFTMPILSSICLYFLFIFFNIQL